MQPLFPGFGDKEVNRDAVFAKAKIPGSYLRYVLCCQGAGSQEEGSGAIAIRRRLQDAFRSSALEISKAASTKSPIAEAFLC